MNTTVEHILNEARKNCYVSNNSTRTTGKFCRLIFDELMCWPDTPAGVLAKQSCSNNYINSTLQGFATRQCNEDGQWFVLPNFTHTWTNYSQCGKFFIQKQVTANSTGHEIYSQWLPVIKNITQFGYILSIMSLVVALFIFIYIKRLHCSRNNLHIHLFLSFIMRALMSLLKDGLFVKGTALIHDTVYINGQPIFMKDNYSWICKAITSLRHYFIVCNYVFLLMEGTYLHNLMFLNLFAESGVTIYCILGWAIPVIFVIPWIILKANGENAYCWTQKSNKYIALLIEVPIGLSVTINFILFTIIMRILFVKFTSMYIQHRRVKYKKLLRSTLILVPLFGIPYTISFILSFYVSKSQTFEILWLFFDQTFTAFQGVFASMVYCFLNSEVQLEIKRKYNSFKDCNNKEFKRSRTISHTQQMPLNEELQDFPQSFGKKDQLIVKKTSEYF